MTPRRPICMLLATATLALGGLTFAGAPRDAPPPFIPVTTRTIPLPAGTQPLWPIFTHDGNDILFQNGADRNVWTVRGDGTALHCITCVLAAERPLPRGFVHDFPDGKRLLLADGVAGVKDLPAGANAWVLECEGTLRTCAAPRLLPVDMSAAHGPASVFQRRTFHMSPDAALLGWMEVRSDGTVLVVARLERRGDRYVAADPRVVNPQGPRSPDDDDAERWENLSQLYELKSFTPDGKAVLIVGTPNLNVDVLRVELDTGRTTRLTAHPDWDEDGGLSPDQTLFAVHSWRGQRRMDAFAWIPELRGFTGLGLGAAIAPYYVSTWEGFQCDLPPWLLSAGGDGGGRLMGQPLRVYGDPGISAGDNVQGQRTWSPDSRTVLLEERTRTRGIATPSHIVMAELDRPPSQPVRFVPTPVGNWAPPAADYRGPHAQDRRALVRGRSGGTATIAYTGKLGDGAAATRVTFDRFTDDGRTFVSGTLSSEAAAVGDGERRAWVLKAAIRVTGAHTGSLDMDLTVDNGAKPLPEKTGTIRAVYDGKVAPPLPVMGPCYDTQPKAAPLRLALRRTGSRVEATVTGDVLGDVRPVMNATVRLRDATARTDANGRASLPYPAETSTDVTATAGSTFVPARAPLPTR